MCEEETCGTYMTSNIVCLHVEDQQTHLGLACNLWWKQDFIEQDENKENARGTKCHCVMVVSLQV